MKSDWSRKVELAIILAVLLFMVAVLATPIFIYLIH